MACHRQISAGTGKTMNNFRKAKERKWEVAEDEGKGEMSGEIGGRLEEMNEDEGEDEVERNE